MTNALELTDKTFGRLTVLARADNGYTVSLDPYSRWHCLCECGANVIVRGTNLVRTRDPTQSCGCYATERKQEANRKRRKK